MKTKEALSSVGQQAEAPATNDPENMTQSDVPSTLASMTLHKWGGSC